MHKSAWQTISNQSAAGPAICKSSDKISCVKKLFIWSIIIICILEFDISMIFTLNKRPDAKYIFALALMPLTLNCN